MRQSSTLTLIRRKVAEAKAEGITEVSIEKLEKFLEDFGLEDQIEREAAALDSAKALRRFEVWKRKRDQKWMKWQEENRWKQEAWRIRSQFRADAQKIRSNGFQQSGLAACKAMLWLNGGGAAAFLAFMATAAKNDAGLSFRTPELSWGLGLLFAGAVLAAAAPGLDYLASPWRFGSGRKTTARKWVRGWFLASVAAGVLSLVCFCIGGYWIYLGLTHIKP